MDQYGQLRELTLQDRKEITALFSDVFTNAPWYDDWSDQAQLDAYIADLTGQAYSLTLGWFEGGRLAGLSMGHVKHWHSGTEYIIEEFCVARERQGKGLGTAFMRAIERYLTARGIRRIFLQTDSHVPAYTFYLHRGFRELDSHVSFAKQLDSGPD